jgi:hypothetical protein
VSALLPAVADKPSEQTRARLRQLRADLALQASPAKGASNAPGGGTPDTQAGEPT